MYSSVVTDRSVKLSNIPIGENTLVLGEIGKYFRMTQ